jgi:predicted N-acetyltransferase YhbS
MATLPDNRLRLRPMTASDVASVHALSQGEQWPHRKQDIAEGLKLGAGTVAEIGGEIIASAMWWLHGDDLATLGMYIVAKPFRGGGIGRIVMEAVLDRIGERSILLNAYHGGPSIFRKFGFSGISEILQHQGTSFSVPLLPLEEGERIRPLGESDHGRVADLAQAATGLERPAIMAAILDKGHGIVLDREGEVIGFAIFRRFGRGYVVGPVVAPDQARAKSLIAQWLGSRSGEFTRLDILGECGLGDWLEELGLVQVNRFVTMVRGEEARPARPGQSFAIISQALF